MKSGTPDGCALHGPSVQPDYLIGRRLVGLTASWHEYGDDDLSGPVDVWLLDSEGESTLVTTGSDWCLIIEKAVPFEAYDMGQYGRILVTPIEREIPLAAHLGEAIRAVHEEWEPGGGRAALELVFDSGIVRCTCYSGDLHLSTAMKTAEF